MMIIYRQRFEWVPEVLRWEEERARPQGQGIMHKNCFWWLVMLAMMMMVMMSDDDDDDDYGDDVACVLSGR